MIFDSGLGHSAIFETNFNSWDQKLIQTCVKKILRDIQTFFKGINILKGIVHSFLFDCIYAFDCFTCNYWLNHF